DRMAVSSRSLQGSGQGACWPRVTVDVVELSAMLLLEGRAAGAAEFRPLATDLAALWASDAHCGRSHRLWHLAYRRHRGVSCRKGCLVPRNVGPDYPVSFLGV